MRRILANLVRMMIFWLLFFTLGRIGFMLLFTTSIGIEGVSFAEIMGIFWHAIKLDVSTACYLLAFPFLVGVVQSQWKAKALDTVQRIFVSVAIVLYSLIVAAEMGIYPEWKSKLDMKALLYLKHPEEIAESTSLGNFLFLLSVAIVLSVAGIWAFQKYFYRNGRGKTARWYSTVVYAMLFPVFLFTGIRGGWQPIPINPAEAYFSKHNLVNQIAVNPGFNLLQSYLDSQNYLEENPFLFYPVEEAKSCTRELHRVEKDTTISFLTTKRPNIVMIILESWSADLIGSLGGKPGITPEFRKLEQEGVLFTRFYATGNRSQQGMASVFGGFPSLPMTAISNHFSKFVKLPSLVKELKKAGYTTSYYFGGQLIYGGLRAYILFNDFDKITEEKDLPASLPRGRLGVHDQYMLGKMSDDLRTEKQPFFAVLFTLSTHSPYDQPMNDVITWAGEQNGYLNSAYYTDKCLGTFFDRARKEPWFNNTVFLIVADHSHNTYRNWWVNSPEYRKIPFWMGGEAVKKEFRGKQIDCIGSQTDIAATLLSQLGLGHRDFFWSRNLMNPTTREFSFYEIQVGCGWIRPDGAMVYQKNGDRLELMTFPDSCKTQRIREGKSYLQTLFQQFMDY